MILQIVDSGSISDSQSTWAWLAQRPQIALVPLPSHAIKPSVQERAWRWLRIEVTHSRACTSLGDLVAAAECFHARRAAQPNGVRQRIGMMVHLSDQALAKVTRITLAEL